MTDSCPNCGKPTRPGSRYCGSCGTTLQESSPLRARTEEVKCPHCGKPVRKDARFCPSCGQAIALEGEPEIPAAEQAGRTAVVGVTIRPPAQAEEGPVPAPDDSDLEAEEPPPASTLSRYWWVFLIIIFCGVIVIAGVYLFNDRDPLGIRSTKTPAATSTLPAVDVTETAAVEPTAAVEESSTSTATPEPAPAAAQTAPPTIPPPVIILDERFDGKLSANWVTWGLPQPKIGGAPINPVLELNGEPRSTGITTRISFSFTPMLEIRFDALSGTEAPGDILAIDLDPGTSTRKPGDSPAVINLEIGDGKQALYTASNTPACQRALTDTNPHTYQIQFVKNASITLKVDGETICTVTAPEITQPEGRLSLSGSGWIDQLQVTH